MKKSRLIKILIAVVVLANLAMASIFVFHEFFNFTSSNSAIYVLNGKKGGIEISRDLMFEDADRMIFMLDANCVFNYFMRGVAVAKGKPVLELTWNAKEGVGNIKQFRTDGTMLALSFSRFNDDSGTPRGLFLGGDLPYGDISRSPDHETSGFGYYDGKKWSHIWCSANEGINLSGTKYTVVPPLWNYEGGRVIKNAGDEVILESEHSTELNGNKIKMKRYVRFRAGDDYFTLKVRIINANITPISYGYAYGDEPWIGDFGASEGDVGWYKEGLIKYEKFISPVKHGYAGYWDHGNDAADERHNYTGYANFIEWVSPTPSYVFFSNTLDYCCSELLPLYAKHNRVINLLWLNQVLLPGESNDHTMVIGMARVDPSTGFPKKPDVRVE